MHSLVEESITKSLRPYVETKAKQQKLMESHKLRRDRLESMIDYHGKELAILKDRVTAVK